MKKPVIYQAVLEPLTEEDVLVITKGFSIEERLGNNGYCPDCGSKKWWILPAQSVAVIEGGKPYCECFGCGYSTHL